MYSYTIFLVLLCSEVAIVLNEEDSYCKTPDQKPGICILIQNCDFVKSLFSGRPNINYLQQLTCGFVGKDPLVCCPIGNNTTERQTTASTTATTISTATAPSVDNFNLSTSRESRMNLVEDVLLRPPNCGFSDVQLPRVVGGIPAKLGQFPWVASLGYKNTEQPALTKWNCGGTLISKKHVLTAAHCVVTSQELYIVRLGDLDLYSDDDGATPSDILIKSTAVHEKYSGITFENDIAIVTLSSEVNNPTVWPICLPVDEPLRSQKFVRYNPFVAGWGKRDFRGPSSSTLMTVSLPVVDNAKCARSYARFARVNVDDRILCAGFEQGGKDACNGDSGGPLMHATVQGKNSTYYLIGVVSLGYKCAEPGYPGIYTRVTHFIDWIQSKLQP